MSKFLNVGDAFVAIDQIESISNIAVHARTLGKRAVIIRTKSQHHYNTELTVDEIKALLEIVTGSTWNVR